MNKYWWVLVAIALVLFGIVIGVEIAPTLEEKKTETPVSTPSVQVDSLRDRYPESCIGSLKAPTTVVSRQTSEATVLPAGTEVLILFDVEQPLFWWAAPSVEIALVANDGMPLNALTQVEYLEFDRDSRNCGGSK